MSRRTNMCNNKNLELDVLATLVFGNEQHKITMLDEEDFYSLDTRDIFRTFLKTYNQKGVIDASILSNESNYTLIVNRNTAILPSQLDLRIGELKDLTGRRKIKAISEQANIMAQENKSSQEIRNWQIGELEKIRMVKDPKVEELDQRFEDILGGNQTLSVLSGYRKFDYLVGGFLEGTFNVIAAGQGVGKTTLAVNMMCNICKRGKRVLFATIEMSPQLLYSKIISHLTGISYREILMGKVRRDDKWVEFGEWEWKRINQARAEVASYSLELFGERGMTTADIKSKIIEIGGCDIVFVDYLQMLIPVEAGRSNYEKISNVAAELKNVALETTVPLVVISSINRDYSDRSDYKPQIADLRGSGEIEFAADMVILLHRESAFRKARPGEDEIEFEHHGELIVAKDRCGESNLVIRLYFDGARSLITEATEIKQEKLRSDIYG